MPSPETAPVPAGLPTGTVTFVFTDIAGSTQRWERDRAAMQDAVRRHDALMGAAIEAHGGYVFKTIGDAFCAVFARPEDAMAAALDAQRALGAEDFSAVDGVRVRVALHTGTADERDGDYFGPAVNRVARLLAIGHGGQVLVSGTAAGLLQGEMPPQTSLRDLGAHRLKDLARPEQVCQLVAPDLPETFPALRSLDALPNNLPQQLTSFVERDHEVAEIKALLQKNRLVTLVGTGGAGKTRCAQQVGADLLDGSGEGVWLVELAPTSDASLVSNVIAQALNVQETPNHPMLETLLAYLKRKRLLLILDNCEHVIDEARNVMTAILRSAPDVHVLATSREGLSVAGEHVYRMPSLSVPPMGDSLTAETVRRYGAVVLFADRALASSGRFALRDEDAHDVAEICRRLDGIPLAIELAAARVKVLSPQQLLQKLDERFRVLTGGDRTALPRQQTMRALIDWSYDLLSDDERALFRKLSIFAGGFTLESASAMCAQEARNGAQAVDEMAIVDLLSSLVDKSLVQAEPAGSGTRFRLLESTRQYARDKLTERGEYEAVARAHAAAYLALAEQLERAYETTPDRAWSAQAEPELENWRAALEWTLAAAKDVPLGQRLTGALRRAWLFFAATEGRRWVRAALDAVAATTPTAVVAKLYLAEADLDTARSRYKASYASAQQALTRYRDVEDPLGAASAQRYAGLALLALGRIPEGEALLNEALRVACTRGAPKLTAGVLLILAMARQLAVDFAAARTRYAEALAAAKASGAERTELNVAAQLAELEFQDGNASAALALGGESLAGYRSQNDTRVVAIQLSNMAAYLVALGRYDEARTRAREALNLFRDVRSEVHLAYVLQHLAAVEALRHEDEVERAHAAHGWGRDCAEHSVGESAPKAEIQFASAALERTRAARLVGYVDARLTALEALREYTERHEYDRMLAALRDALGEEQLATLMNEGRAWTEDHAVAEALLV